MVGMVAVVFLGMTGVAGILNVHALTSLTERCLSGDPSVCLSARDEYLFFVGSMFSVAASCLPVTAEWYACDELDELVIVSSMFPCLSCSL